ncbi:MAG TPA: glycosyltransferase family 2 protein [Acidimicrobiia bacterium]
MIEGSSTDTKERSPSLSPDVARRVAVLLPAYNEAENLPAVVAELVGVLQDVACDYEIVVIDDGSTDGTRAVVAELCAQSPNVRGMRLRRNVGKSPALAAGIESVTADVVVLMDADGQDQPSEIPRMIEALDGGLDLVTGRRAERNDRFVKRTTSILYNGVTARVSGVPGRDFNSGFKAMTAEVASSLELYGELHRYIPVLAFWNGYRVGEIDVEHRPRLHGQSKFGAARFWRGFLDLVTVRFLTSYANRPLHLFGAIGTVFSVAGSAVLLWLLVEQQVYGKGIGSRPALIAGMLLVIVGVQILSLGLIAQLLVHLAVRRDPLAWVEQVWPDSSHPRR